MNKFLLIACIASAAISSTGRAQTGADDHAAHHPPTVAAPGANHAAFIDGEVRRVDTTARTLTLRHGAIPNLGLPETTAAFQVADSRLLEGLKAGDKVRFRVERIGGQSMVVAVEPVP